MAPVKVAQAGDHLYKGRRVFRRSPGMLLVFVGVTALFAVVAWTTYRDRGWGLVSIAMACVTVVLGVGSIVESLILRIELADDAMLVTELTGRKRYSKAEIESIHEAKGVSPILLLKSGRRIPLPSVASELGNSVRAWLKSHN